MILPLNQNILYYSIENLPCLAYSQLVLPNISQNPYLHINQNIISNQPLFVENTECLSGLKDQKKVSKIQPFYEIRNSHLNTKNVIPNIIRKLFSFLISERCQDFMYKIDPQLQRIEITEIFSMIHSIKNSLGSYAGKKSLKKLWFYDNNTCKNFKAFKLIRKVCRYYLQGQCINSIILSKRMKSQLKVVHLKYRRKLLKLLNSTNSETV